MCVLKASALGTTEFVQASVQQLKNVRDTINTLLPYQPIVLVGGTAILVHGVHYLIARVPNDGTYLLTKRFKKKF